MEKWYLRTQDETFGPETQEKLIEWARLGRIQPGQEISEDNVIWTRVEDVPFLDMRFSIDIGDGNPRGPFNRAAAEALLASGRLPPTSSLVETREPFSEPQSEPVPQQMPASEPEPTSEADTLSVEEPRVIEKVVEVPVEKIVEVEKVVEKIVEVPVEKIVEKEVRVEVPVEKIVEVEKIVIDETRVKELEGLLEEERRHSGELRTKVDETSRNAAEAAKAATEREAALKGEIRVVAERADKLEAALRDATDRENKFVEQVAHLEDELRRLPQAASEVADIQAAVYSIMKGESEELERLLEAEKREFEVIKKRYAERSDRLVERRRELLKRSGANIEDMTRKALITRPEDPRTAQIRKEFEELSHAHDRMMMESSAKIRELTEELRRSKAEHARAAESQKDVTQLRLEVQNLQERLQARENELVAERQRMEEIRQQQATKQQALLARLASLESPSIGTSQTISTNQSREAHQVKLPGWMRLGR